jgi:hypothetical protein
MAFHKEVLSSEKVELDSFMQVQCTMVLEQLKKNDYLFEYEFNENELFAFHVNNNLS